MFGNLFWRKLSVQIEFINWNKLKTCIFLNFSCDIFRKSEVYLLIFIINLYRNVKELVLMPLWNPSNSIKQLSVNKRGECIDHIPKIKPTTIEFMYFILPGKYYIRQKKNASLISVLFIKQITSIWNVLKYYRRFSVST